VAEITEVDEADQVKASVEVEGEEDPKAEIQEDQQQEIQPQQDSR
jgi:hypothetical protein